LTVFLLFLSTLLVVSVVLFFVLPNFLEFRDGTPYFPFLDGWRAATESPTPDNPTRQVTAPPPTPTPADTPTPTPTRTPPPRSELPIHALYAPLDVLSDGGALETLKEQLARGEADALVLELKAEDGTLAFPSSLPPAIQAKVSAEDDGAVRLIRALRAGGVYVVARVSCFKDALLPQQIQTVGVKHVSGLNWLDNQRGRWLDPYKADAVDYLLDLLSEIAGLGVDEILLDWVTFPTRGALSSISYGSFAGVPRYEPIEDFVKRARGAVASSGAALSMVLSAETCLNGADETGGQRLSALAPSFDRFYISVPLSGETGSEFAALTGHLGASLPRTSWPAKLVPMLPVTGRTDPEDLRAALQEAGGRQGLGWMLENDKGEYPEL
jgi:hypothetical protein